MKTAGFLIAVGLLIAGCGGDDPHYRPTGPGVEPPWVPEVKDDVLYVLELAYNERNFAEFEKLLDENFVFVFSEDDFNRGAVPFPSWERTDEIAASQKIFDPNLEGGKRVISIDLRLYYPEGDWTEETANESHPDESWFTKTVEYNLVVKTADNWEHRANGLKAQFTLREDDTTGGWRIVLWADDFGSYQALSPGAAAVETTTWGIIKAQYHE
jgi:hypothetical protein